MFTVSESDLLSKGPLLIETARAMTSITPAALLFTNTSYSEHVLRICWAHKSSASSPILTDKPLSRQANLLRDFRKGTV